MDKNKTTREAIIPAETANTNKCTLVLMLYTIFAKILKKEEMKQKSQNGKALNPEIYVTTLRVWCPCPKKCITVKRNVVKKAKVLL